MNATATRVKNRLRHPIVLICAILLVFSTIILWVFYFAQLRLFEEVMVEQSGVEARLVKRTYEIEQLEMKVKEKELDDYLLRQSKQAAIEVRKLKTLDKSKLHEIIDRFDITGLWVIGEDNKIRAGTTDDVGSDTTGFYSEFIDGDFVNQIDKIRHASGSSWVSPFKLSHHKNPKGYMKYAYTSTQNPEDLGEIIVVETGASIDAIKSKRYGSDRFVTRHTLPENIQDVKINETYNGPDDRPLKTKKEGDYHYKSTLIVDDLAGESLLTVDLTFEDLRSEQRKLFFVTTIATLFMMFTFFAAIYVRERQRFSNVVAEEFRKQQQ